jgi:hypothetical protein
MGILHDAEENALAAIRDLVGAMGATVEVCTAS